MTRPGPPSITFWTRPGLIVLRVVERYWILSWRWFDVDMDGGGYGDDDGDDGGLPHLVFVHFHFHFHHPHRLILTLMTLTARACEPYHMMLNRYGSMTMFGYGCGRGGMMMVLGARWDDDDAEDGDDGEGSVIGWAVVVVVSYYHCDLNLEHVVQDYMDQWKDWWGSVGGSDQ